MSDKYPNKIWFYYVAVSAGLSTFVLYQFKPFIILFADKFGLMYGPLVASVLLFGMPFTIFGMMSPFCIRLLVRKTKSSGSISGRVFAASTVGSLAGALLTGFWLIPLLPVSRIITLVTGLIVVTALFGIALNFSEFKKGKPIQSVFE